MLDLGRLAEFVADYPDVLTAEVQPFEVKGQLFEHWPQPSIMGVVNLSADSWYRESVVLNVDAAVRRGRRLAVEGAAIVDVGAESTILDALRVDASTQTSMLTPVVSQLSDSGIVVSAETYHPEVTRACLEAGAGVVNMTAAVDTEAFYRLAADHEAAVIICYLNNADNVREASDFELVADHTARLYDYFARETDKAQACGVSRLWIDPGLGFYYKNLLDSADRVRYQVDTFINASRLRTLGWPVCQALPHAFEYFEDEVRTAEPFFGTLATLARTDLLRTHEVAKVRGVVEAMSVVD